MPEGLVVASFDREIKEGYSYITGREKRRGISGRFIPHPRCCANAKGRRPTFYMHSAAPTDPLFLPLPRGMKEPKRPNGCTTCPPHDINGPLPPADAERDGETRGEEDVEEDTSDEESEMEESDSDAEESDTDAEESDSDAAESEGDTEEEHDGEVDGIAEDALDTQDDALEAPGQTFRQVDLSDPEQFKSLGGKPAAIIAAHLPIEGRLHSTVRGKELMLGIANYFIRISFSLEGHCFWIPTSMYNKIITGKMSKRGKKSRSFTIPRKYCDGPRSARRKISIQAAFVSKNATLIFVDHNVMLTFHVMRFFRAIKQGDLVPTSRVWPRLWSLSHGPVHYQEPQKFDLVLDQWRMANRTANRATSKPIFVAMKYSQDIFNGFGAQETADVLVSAFIHPMMPVHAICSDNNLWEFFLLRIKAYPKERLQCLFDLPFVSSRRPFKWNGAAHILFMRTVLCYRREKVAVDEKWLEEVNRRNLLNSSYIIQTNGFAKPPCETTPSMWNNDGHMPSNFAIRSGCKRIKLQNFNHTISRARPDNTYSPFLAQLPLEWRLQNWSIYTVNQDAKVVQNETTLGPYSFRVFVDMAWTSAHMDQKSRPKGRRPVIRNGRSNSKRPKLKQINIQRPKSETICVGGGKENRCVMSAVEIPIEDVNDIIGGRVLRKRKRM